MIINAIELSKELMACNSVTPADGGAIAALEAPLKKLGFTCFPLSFTSKEDPSEVKNLYARLGKSGKNLCFAGHTDVVPPGDLSLWKNNPFKPMIEDGRLYGRGASDMKTAIAAWAAAVSEYLSENKKFEGSLSFLITGDEEDLAFKGTKKVLEWMQEKGEKIDACIVGEPTSVAKLGDTIKIGRRGSISFALSVHGQQGHAAYPHLADNPTTRLVNILHELKNHTLDKPTEYFSASNLEVTTIDIGNKATNVIPAAASAKFNIRFNDIQNSAKLEKWVREVCKKYAEKFELSIHITGEAFLTKPGELSSLVAKSIKKTLGYEPELSTSGGTSDARFIKHYCPTLEFGLLNSTAHKVNENMPVKDIENLVKAYKEIISAYFS